MSGSNPTNSDYEAEGELSEEFTGGNGIVRGAVDKSKEVNIQIEKLSDPLAKQLFGLPYNDSGNAKRLVARYSDDLIYVTDVGWHHWTGTHWSIVGGHDSAMIYADETAQKIENEVRYLRTNGAYYDETESQFKERAKKLKNWAISSGNVSRIDGMIKISQPYLTEFPQELDRNPQLLNLKNGTLVLEGVCQNLHPHDRTQRITGVLPIEYDPEATAPEFYRFLNRIQPLQERQIFLQKLVGCCLTGLTREQAIFFFYGDGANGKSVFLNCLAGILGDYCQTLPFESIQHNSRRSGGDATPDLARLVGSRLVRISEPEKGARFSEGQLKSLTGGEPISVRKLFKEGFEYTPEFKIILSGNFRPEIRGNDHGIWRRMVLVPFEEVLSEHEQVPDLDKKLIAKEAPGILNWALDGLRMYLEEGLTLPPSIKSAVEMYQDENNPVGRFVSQNLIYDPGQEISAKVMYESYLRWCDANNEKSWKQRSFGMELNSIRIGPNNIPIENLRKRSSQLNGAKIYVDLKLAEGEVHDNSYGKSDDSEQ
ncbi:MAG: hypothetical protein HOE97_01720 [Rhodospirillaceae bacterium]|jgi:putative DNA primase/helicase|nr:hypothetical protein [Rhodospirillaceae bacterium]